MGRGYSKAVTLFLFLSFICVCVSVASSAPEDGLLRIGLQKLKSEKNKRGVFELSAKEYLLKVGKGPTAQCIGGFIGVFLLLVDFSRSW